ncbi:MULTISPECIES: NUDIX domain-containing protein [Protofrankia]|uniref:NUDIX hydrolase n=1 Tax=Candidatus Protofrankia datiscae TaxID=2716812 RepID=F8B5H6_9ACTN|nr:MULTISPECIES: NUDIX domain-containing protein [Protofrankia]AEH09146.1 NUDIX hydrolase [Candidatus Protofrankia datiscae]
MSGRTGYGHDDVPEHSPRKAHREMSRSALPVRVHLLVRTEDRILLATGDETSPACWRLPAGNLQGQAAGDAAVRLAREQAALLTTVEDVRLEHVAHHWADDREQLGLFFHVTRTYGATGAHDPAAPGVPRRPRRLAWHPLDALPERFAQPDHDVVTRWASGEFFSHGGWTARRSTTIRPSTGAVQAAPQTVSAQTVSTRPPSAPAASSRA